MALTVLPNSLRSSSAPSRCAALSLRKSFWCSLSSKTTSRSPKMSLRRSRLRLLSVCGQACACLKEPRQHWTNSSRRPSSMFQRDRERKRRSRRFGRASATRAARTTSSSRAHGPPRPLTPSVHSGQSVRRVRCLARRRSRLATRKWRIARRRFLSERQSPLLKGSLRCASHRSRQFCLISANVYGACLRTRSPHLMQMRKGCSTCLLPAPHVQPSSRSCPEPPRPRAVANSRSCSCPRATSSCKSSRRCGRRSRSRKNSARW
mmetsp:Transcript_5807/g.7428  ORF Transcript_5807/g.7428 Transcript_5807/m.7428 type:complete len:263 (-) Transcript_5807:939-1727(-)